MGRAKHADSQRDKIFYALVNILLVGAIAAVLYPLVYVVSSSFSSPSAVMSGKVWLYPVELSLEGYKAVFRHKFILSGFANSTFYAAVGTLVNVGITTLAAYPLSRKDLRPRGAIMLVFAFTMFFHRWNYPDVSPCQQSGTDQHQGSDDPSHGAFRLEPHHHANLL